MSDQYHLKFSGNSAQSVDAYLEYKRIVGEDDGGTLFTEEEYEEYKRKKIPLRIKNRLYTCYTSPSGMDCKLIGPETPCFCTHRYKQHKTDFEEIPTERPILLPCQVRGCACIGYHYVPLNGSMPIRCHCKHTADEHNVKKPYVCKRPGCTKCTGFKSSFTCSCGSSHSGHSMIVETAEEREARGHPLGESTPYQAMGGLTGFSSLAEGYLRLDPSGRGAPSEEFLNQAITAHDDPFLRSQVKSIKAHQMAKSGGHAVTAGNEQIFDDIEERVSSVKKPGESDMDFFERRFQERLKLEAEAKKKALPANPYTQKPTKVGSRTSVSSSSSRTKSSKGSKPQPGTSRS